MKTLRYLFYDNVNDINTKDLIVNAFKYNNKTKTKELYLELRNKFYPKEENIIDFVVVDNIYNDKISFYDLNKYLVDLLNCCNLDNIVLIYPILPIGGTGLVYRGYRIYIHSNESIHKNLPHVHVEYGGFEETRINLKTLEIMDDDIFHSKKDKKIIMKYLKNNQERWTEYYNSIVVNGKDPGMNIEKII
jgi:hypothetical protein